MKKCFYLYLTNSFSIRYSLFFVLHLMNPQQNHTQSFQVYHLLHSTGISQINFYIRYSLFYILHSKYLQTSFYSKIPGLSLPVNTLPLNKLKPDPYSHPNTHLMIPLLYASSPNHPKISHIPYYNENLTHVIL